MRAEGRKKGKEKNKSKGKEKGGKNGGSKCFFYKSVRMFFSRSYPLLFAIKILMVSQFGDLQEPKCTPPLFWQLFQIPLAVLRICKKCNLNMVGSNFKSHRVII